MLQGNILSVTVRLVFRISLADVELIDHSLEILIKLVVAGGVRLDIIEPLHCYRTCPHTPQ